MSTVIQSQIELRLLRYEQDQDFDGGIEPAGRTGKSKWAGTRVRMVLGGLRHDVLILFAEDTSHSITSTLLSLP